MKDAFPAVCVSIVLSLPLAGSLFAAGGGGDEIRRILIEKTREREELFDNVDVRYTFTHIRAEHEPSVVTSTGTAHWVRSGERFRLETDGISHLAGKAKTFSKTASDGEFRRTLVSRLSRDPLVGWIDKHSPTSSYSLVEETLDNFGVTLLPTARKATLGEMLAGEAENIEVAVLPEETVEGLDCLVVDCIDGHRNYVNRLYFAKGLNFACVRVEQRRDRGAGMVPHENWVMSDFREVKPGLFVPFSVRMEEFDDRGPVEDIAEYKILSVDFPAVIDPGTFTLEFPSGTRMRDPVTGTTYTVGEGTLPEAAVEQVLEAAVEEAPEDLEEEPRPTVPEPPAAASQAEQPPREPEAPPEETKRQNLAVVVSILLGAVLLAVAAIVLWRKRRR